MGQTSKRVFVTGANRGLGLSFARLLSDRGWQVYGSVRESAALEPANEAIGGQSQLFCADVTEDEGWHSIADEIGELDLLINNAGINGPVEPDGTAPRQKLGQLDLTAWQDVFQTNVIGQLRVTEAFLPALRARQGKQIAYISSLLGSVARARDDKMLYRTSKAALNMAAAIVAQNLAPEGFRVGAICPGWVRTRMGGEQASLPADVAAAKALENFERMEPGTFVMRNENGEILPW